MIQRQKGRMIEFFEFHKFSDFFEHFLKMPNSIIKFDLNIY